ncbi:caspase family protein [Kitasatospora viridis]|uniref:Caspase domain-containing protein n=1 Tax=Kitasatospora viridis TaxID=281105 RepID=A0A561SFI8_9ACTN|nr:caspase family protein [Kitasatospora viridis]TWF73622.1 hypothetical protein FHX73_15235 [Kitasatospora viridis]
MASRAVVIAPARYAADSGIPGYSWIGASARMYGEVLTGDPMWGPGACRVLDESQVHTAAGVMAELQLAADAAGPEDTLLVVYVGHGAYWGDLPGAQVHFSVGSSYDGKPWTWLSSWYVYRTMRRSRARLKVLIADCCRSNLLPQLGDEPLLPGVLGELDQGTCVLTALRNADHASAEGCSALPGELAECTPFSGHLLNVLRTGTQDHHARLTLGLVRDAVKQQMHVCPTPHDVPRMSLNDARESTPLFTNRMASSARNQRPRRPVEAEQWVRTLRSYDDSELEELLADPRKTGEVVALLHREADEGSRLIAQRIDAEANSRYAEPHDFARYWNRVQQALRG